MDRAAYTRAWIKVYREEIALRKKIQAEKPRAFKKLFAKNPKGLIDDCGGKHVWIPASTLWIHDNDASRRSTFVIDGFNRHGLAEADPRTFDNCTVVPQMCFRCVKTRELVMEKISYAERQAAYDAAARKNGKRGRGRAGESVMLDDLEDLYA